MKTPAWQRVTYRGMEAGVALALVILAVVLLVESVRLGPGWGESGPQPGFFPFVLTVLMVIGAVGVMIVNVFLQPDPRPLFELSQSLSDMLRVLFPIVAAVLLIRWAGIYVTSGVYMAFFMAWYGKFRWYQAVAGGVILPAVLWGILREGFNIGMPMSMFYRSGILPF